MGIGLGVRLHSSVWAVWPFWGWPGHFGARLECLQYILIRFYASADGWNFAMRHCTDFGSKFLQV